jgi:hypothetical protein
MSIAPKAYAEACAANRAIIAKAYARLCIIELAICGVIALIATHYGA